MIKETDLKAEFEKHQYLYIVDADDLIAAWCYQRRVKHLRSYDFPGFRPNTATRRRSPKMPP